MSFLKGSLNVHSGLKVGLVTARFNSEITSKLESGAIEKLMQLGVQKNQVIQVSVPGAVEIPLAVQWMLKQGFDGVIALGAVIRGETAHFDYVCRSVERGCSNLALEYSKPVVFGVLTTDTDEQAADRVGGKHGHKGQEAAEVLLEMINLKALLNKNP